MLGPEHPRDAEVHHLDGAAVANHQVGGLEVAMDDPAAMRVPERVEHLHAQMRGLGRRERPEPIRQIVERLPAHELHHHQQLVVLLMMQLVDSRDARVVETRERDRLGAETLQHIRVGQVGIEDLDRDLAVERLIDRLVDGAHTAATQLVDDAVLSDGGPDHCWKSWQEPKFVSVGGPIPLVKPVRSLDKRDPCRTRSRKRWRRQFADGLELPA